MAYGVTNHPFKHSEYVLLEEIRSKGITIEASDIVYVTVEPCGKRTPGGEGEKLGDCTTNLIMSGVKHIVFAAADPHAAGNTRERFAESGCELRQVSDKDIIDRSDDIFNSNLVRGGSL